jgi:hypothetical protein
MDNEFHAGEALGKGFGIWFKNLAAFLVLAVLAFSPLIVYTAVTTSGPLYGDLDKMVTYTWVSWLMKQALGLLVAAAVLYGTIQQLGGNHASIAASIGVGLKRLLPVTGVGILVLIATGSWFVLAGLLGSQLLLIPALVPALIFYCMLYVAIPAAVIERPGMFGALRRSKQLTADNKWRIFGVVFVLVVIEVILGLGLRSFFSADSMDDHQYKVLVWAGLGLDIAIASLKATIAGVVYHDLRTAREGVATEELARVFE